MKLATCTVHSFSDAPPLQRANTTCIHHAEGEVKKEKKEKKKGEKENMLYDEIPPRIHFCALCGGPLCSDVDVQCGSLKDEIREKRNWEGLAGGYKVGFFSPLFLPGERLTRTSGSRGLEGLW